MEHRNSDPYSKRDDKIDEGPEKKKMKTGRISPRALFAFIKEEVNSKSKQDKMNASKTNTGWKPPLKTCMQELEIMSTSYSQKNSDKYERLLTNYSQPNLKHLDSLSCESATDIVNPETVETYTEIKNNNTNVELYNEENNSDNYNEHVFSGEEIPISGDQLSPESEKMSAEMSFDSSRNIDNCIEKQEALVPCYTELINKKELSQKCHIEDTEKVEHSPVSNDESINGLEFSQKSNENYNIDGSKLENEKFQKDAEENNTDNYSVSGENSSSLLHLAQSGLYEVNSEENKRKKETDNVAILNNSENHTNESQKDCSNYLDQDFNNSDPHLLSDDKTIINHSGNNFSPCSPQNKDLVLINKNLNNVLQHDNDNNNNNVKQNCLTMENKMSLQGNDRGLFKNNPHLSNQPDDIRLHTVDDLQDSDPFEVTVSNSQFLRLEKEISTSDHQHFYQPMAIQGRDSGTNIQAFHSKATSLVNQMELHKSILRKMINDIDQLNNAVMKATMSMRCQNKRMKK